MGFIIGAMFGLGLLFLAWSISSPSFQPVENSDPRRKFVARPVSIATKRKRMQVWPDVVDDVASGIRAGLSLPKAVFLIGDHGPEPFRNSFKKSAQIYVTTGNFGESLTHLQQEISDPFGDRFVAAIKVAYELGGSDLGTLMRSLADSIREDIKLRGELMARQSWTINGARLAVAAPWVTAAVLSVRSDAITAYLSPSGQRLLLACLVLSVIAYRIMLRVGRLPSEIRVFA